MSWDALLQDSISTVDDLVEYLDVNEKDRAVLEEICEDHPLRISKYYLSLIDKADCEDPIRRLAVPIIHESHLEGSYDTSGEKSNTVLPGLQHKYRQTAVILATNECAMYCRHCFRKRLVGVDSDEVVKDMQSVSDYIENHKEINNVLITGGDPFVLSTSRIEKLLAPLSEIEHLDFIRFGTRVPVTFPSRIILDMSLREILESYSNKKTRLYVVTQFNHPKEITEESTKACKLLQDAGIIVSNQTVLLRGVNDDSETMAQLQIDLVRIGVVPYYVFQCRPVKRVKKHFQVPLYEACKIIEETRSKLDGHTKRFRFIMSHPTGKIEIIGIVNDRFLFKYHQAKNPRDYGKIFTRRVDKKSTWLDNLST
ncbi:MAG: KamA family radical SAM protein [Candidatus Sifarchaeia archaeon]